MLLSLPRAITSPTPPPIAAHRSMASRCNPHGSSHLSFPTTRGSNAAVRAPLSASNASEASFPVSTADEPSSLSGEALSPALRGHTMGRGCCLRTATLPAGSIATASARGHHGSVQSATVSWLLQPGASRGKRGPLATTGLLSAQPAAAATVVWVLYCWPPHIDTNTTPRTASTHPAHPCPASSPAPPRSRPPALHTAPGRPLPPLASLGWRLAVGSPLAGTRKSWRLPRT